MFRNSKSVFTSASEVSIFSRKKIVGAFAENIFNKIPCCKNTAGDFCFDKSNIIINAILAASENFRAGTGDFCVTEENFCGGTDIWCATAGTFYASAEDFGTTEESFLGTKESFLGTAEKTSTTVKIIKYQ